MLGGLLAAASSIAAPIANFFSQQETNRTNVDMANNQMNFQQAMDKTKHQREVADLKAAGLNPTLSAGGSPGVPSGASATLQAPQIAMPDLLAYGVSLKQMEIKEKELQNNTALS